VTGKAAEKLLGEVDITVNKNTIPFDPESPFVTSGIRLGTPAVTTRGMKEDEMVILADLINDTIEGKVDQKEIYKKVLELCKRFPL
jgi:glycine hydroxymethyltransferase